MGDLAIRVENLGKEYKIGGPKARYLTLRDSLANIIRAPFLRAANLLRGEMYGASDLKESIWALRNLSFNVEDGEVIGVIGRNGAGKSTLLKVLSRITEPTEGRAVIKGRVGSLLEVGTGFHPELTGRENIYLNGSILGMRREEINRKFDEIVEFSGVERFIDTPVKHYSSGMQVRLAFTVAAHLEPEILLVDEVLAVGDAGFQRKSLGKMESVAGQGRTVIFVSHNMGMIQSLCERVILLENGQLKMDGEPEEVISCYLSSYAREEKSTRFTADPDPARPFQILEVALTDHQGVESSLFDINEPVILDITYALNEPITGLAVTLKILQGGTVLLTSFDVDNADQLLEERKPGTYRTKAKIPEMHLKPGRYSVNVGGGILNQQRLDLVESAVSFDLDTLSVGASYKSYSKRREGLVTMPIEWKP